jgi:hypothetical protein
LKYHGLPDDIVSDRGSLFVSNFWKRLMELLKIKTNLSTAYHPQSDGQTERTNAILEQYIRIYCNYKQNNWSSLLSMAQFSYNNATQVSIGTSPFYANYGFHPTFSISPLTFSRVPEAEDLLSSMNDIHSTLLDTMKTSQHRYANYYNQKVKDAPNFQIGALVWLLRKHIKTSRPSEKLDCRRLGPFKIIEKVGSLAYRLELPITMKIHNVFHVSLLEPYIKSRFENARPSPPYEINGELEYEVNEILDSRSRNGQAEYLVDWKGYGPHERTWEPEENLQNAKECLNRYHRLCGLPGVRP